MIYRIKAFVVITLLLLFSCSDDVPAINGNGASKSMPVDFYLVKEEVISQIINAPATVMPSESVMLYSEVSGIVRKINFVEGQQVQKGAVLIEIDADILKSEKQQLEVELDFARKDETRKKELYENRAGSFEQWEIAQSKVNSIEAQLNLVRTKIDKTIMRAPFSGQIGIRSISEGAFITTATSLATLAKNDELKIDFSIPQKYAHLAKVGQKIAVTTSHAEKTYVGEVYAIEPMINAESKMLQLRAWCKECSGLIPGSFVQIAYDLGENEQGRLIPTSALVPVLNGQRIWKMKNGKATSLLVELGQRTEDRVEVAGDLQVGDTVITSGLLSLREGMLVNGKMKP